MPGWQFWKRRSSAMKDQPQALSEKAQLSSQPARATTTAAAAPTLPMPRRSSQHRRRASPRDKKADARSIKSSKRGGSAEKENMHVRRGSIEDITALPVSRRLASSPHLRPVDLERPPIPYNFRPHSASQASIQRADVKSSRPQTLRSRRSGYSSGGPERRRSSKKRKGVDALREEEIRQMSSPIPIPKRPGEGPLRRDSKKMRGLGTRGSNVSLPPEESVHSSMSGVVEQRGWEIGTLDVFSPRPAVRLSGAPQYVAPGTLPAPSQLSRNGSQRDRDKRPVTTDSTKKRQTIGNQADDLDASDLRTLMERDAKRREKRKKEQQEKLDRKLRSRGGRNRGDSDKKKREDEDLRKEEEVRRHAEALQQARDQASTPTDVHPALRDRPAQGEADSVGLGIGAAGMATAEIAAIDLEQAHARAIPTTEQGTVNTGRYLNYPQGGDIPENPFEDPAPSPAPDEPESERSLTMPGAFTPVETPMEDPILHTAQAVRLSQAHTPPLSPVRTGPSNKIPSGLSQSLSRDLPSPPPLLTERRTSEPRERRAGAWASFFRRGGTTLRRPGEEGMSSEFSFSNTSRESMRNQPLPAHLVDPQQPAQRSKSIGAPVRAKSKFREDLPEMPISPPDSRMPSPEVTTAAAAAAAARRAHRSPKPVDIPGARPRDSATDASAIGRNDTPVSPGLRGRGLMSASLASVDSEGSWLASSGKRQSAQSVLSRGMGSLSKRKAEFNASYEELGGDRDAEYVRRMTHSPAVYGHRGISPALAGASLDDESDYGDEPPLEETPADPLTVHGSVRRKPTLVHRDPRVKSREGLLTEYAAGGETAELQDSPEKDGFEEESAETQVQSARSVNYGKSHARQMSAGSAKLLDIPALKRPSTDAGSRDSLTAMPRPASRMSQI
ncbi:hypothetical protein LTR36_009144 [Oleoguttula mirabilis]|uniref:Uncharacterized protein n=1 Tax=Oleoguttula mirabilis TaxID=1507867 RepID=A0AAV9J6B1_9PEZI|nr:hypothetical protein LTR36_009144 [Oleoguttula mirabilis]